MNLVIVFYDCIDDYFYADEYFRAFWKISLSYIYENIHVILCT